MTEEQLRRQIKEDSKTKFVINYRGIYVDECLIQTLGEKYVIISNNQRLSGTQDYRARGTGYRYAWATPWRDINILGYGSVLEPSRKDKPKEVERRRVSEAMSTDVEGKRRLIKENPQAVFQIDYDHLGSQAVTCGLTLDENHSKYCFILSNNPHLSGGYNPRAEETPYKYCWNTPIDQVTILNMSSGYLTTATTNDFVIDRNKKISFD